MASQPSPTSSTPVRSFFGQYQRGVDKKGRVILPARFRELLGDERIFITKGFEKCLILMPTEEYERRRRKMESYSPTQAKARRLKRRFFSNTEEVKPDGMGRINIPQFLRDYADLTGDVVFIGVDSYIEIWDAEQWKQHELELDEEANLEEWEGLE
ncbi:MAG TPA: division/cell wall cluster transcriptional repressor MraZ [Anaerolineae bacterium]|nr:division/cell wall cluster transcriptional repressor MraZ [Anaerolineae bacterium]